MSNKPIPTVSFWAVWLGIILQLVFIQYQLAGGFPTGPNTAEQKWGPLIFIGIELIASIGLRTYGLAKAKTRYHALIVFIIGLALASQPQYMQIYIIGAENPATQRMIIYSTILVVGIWAPVFLKNFPLDQKS